MKYSTKLPSTIRCLCMTKCFGTLLFLSFIAIQPAFAEFTGTNWDSFTAGAKTVCDDTDVDNDNDGLVEICYLEELNAIRYQPEGIGIKLGKGSQFKINSAGCGPEGFLCKGYELVRDLDFDDNDSYRNLVNKAFWGSKTRVGWTPIETFDSIFEGNGHTIANLTIRRRPPASAGFHTFSLGGLFGLVQSEGRIYNLGLLSVDINIPSSSETHVAGSLVGTNYGHIYNSYVSGGKIVSSSNEFEVGGLVGWNDGILSNSYANTSISGTWKRAGGLIGLSFLNPAISNTYSRGDLSKVSASYLGGLIGQQQNSLIEKSYAANKVVNTKAGALIGKSVGKIRQSYWDKNLNTSGKAVFDSSGTVTNTRGLTTEEMQTPIVAGATANDPYFGWSETDWDIGFSDQYPALKHVMVTKTNPACGTSQQPTCGVLLAGQRLHKIQFKQKGEVDEGEVLEVFRVKNDSQAIWKQTHGTDVLTGSTTKTNAIRFTVPTYLVGKNEDHTTLNFTRTLSDDTVENIAVTVHKKDNGQFSSVHTPRQIPNQRKLRFDEYAPDLSEDPDNDPSLNLQQIINFGYHWQRYVRGLWVPVGVGTDYIVPNTVKEDTRFRMRLVYTDGQGYLTRIYTPEVIYKFANTAPNIVVANYTRSIDEGETITLDASNSNDAEKDPLIYNWRANPDFIKGSHNNDTVELDIPPNFISKDKKTAGVVVTLTVRDNPGGDSLHSLRTREKIQLDVRKIDNGKIPLGKITQPLRGNRLLQAPPIDLTKDPDNPAKNDSSDQILLWQRKVAGEWEDTNITGSGVFNYKVSGTTVAGQEFRVQVSYTDGQGHQTITHTEPISYRIENIAPSIAVVPTSINADEGTRISFDASGTTDQNAGDIRLLRYAWEQTAGVDVLSGLAKDKSVLTFDLPEALVEKNSETAQLKFLLTVRDFYDSTTKEVVATVNKVDNDSITLSNLRPVQANNSHLLTAPTITLTDDSDSTEENAGRIVSYHWQKKDIRWFDIREASTASTYRVPSTIEDGTEFRVQIIYEDGQGHVVSLTSEKVEYTLVNSPPQIIIAEAIIQTTEGRSVTFDASMTIDKDEDEIDFSWVQLTPGVNVLADATINTNILTFDLPTTLIGKLSTQTILQFVVTANDGRKTKTKQVEAIVHKKNNGHILLPAPNQPEGSRELIAPKLTLSDDPDSTAENSGSITNYQWQQEVDSTWTDVKAANVTTYIVPYTVKDNTKYRVLIAYTDGQNYATTVSSVAIEYQLVNKPPLISITPTSVDTDEGERVTFDASTTTDEHTELNFIWRQSSGKNVLAGVTTNTDTLTFAVPTALVGKDATQSTLAFLLTVTDIHSAMSTQSVTVVVTKVDNGSIVLSSPSGQPTQADGSRELVAPSLILTTDPDSTAENSGSITNYQWQQEVDSTWTDVEAANVATYTVPPWVPDGTKYQVLIAYTDGQGYATTVPSVAIEYQLVNKPPLISITPASVDTDEGERVTLDASTTTDEHTELNFIWRQSSGTDVLAGVTTNTDTLTFVLPTIFVGKDATQTTLAFLLTVIDIHSAMSTQSVTVVVTKVDNGSIVLSSPSGQPTQADGSRELVAPSLSLTTDPDSTAENSGRITNYQWQQEIDGTWTDIEAANATTYIVPYTVKDNTKYRVLISYTDGQDNTATVPSVAIEYQLVNKPPLISITPASVDADEGEQVTFDASATTDEHTELNFIWRQSSGTDVLAGVTTNTDTLTFAVPTALIGKDTTQTTLAFLLTVTDIHSAMSTQSVTVVVTKVDNGSIVLSGLSGQPTQADGSRELVAPSLSLTTDPDSTAENSGSITNYQWQQEIDGTWTDLEAANVATYTVPPWVPDGTKYQVLIAYTDGQGYATTVSSVAVEYQLVNKPPLISITPTSVDADEGEQVTLDASTTTDEHTTLNFIWRQSSGTGVLAGVTTNTDTLTFVLPIVLVGKDATQTTLTFLLTVTDIHSAVSTQSVTVVVNKVDNGSIVLSGPSGQPTQADGSRELVAPSLSLTTDPDSTAENSGSITNYQWQQEIDGTWTDVEAANVATYTVPYTVKDNTKYRVLITYTDGQDNIATVPSVAIEYQLVNKPPLISITPASVDTDEGERVTFDASATTDEHTALNFIWRQSSGTDVLAGVTKNTDTLTFVLPTVFVGKDTTQTTLAFLLTVTDIHSAVSTQSVTVVVTKVDNGSIVLSGPSGQPTQADGSRELVAPNLSLTTDPDSTAENSGRITNYQWQQEIDGTWTDVEAANATTYIVPYTVKDNTKYRVLITYTDGQDNTATVPSVAIEYQLVNKPPLISITPASVDADEGERVTFDASTTTDEHTELNFIWRQSSGTNVLAGVTKNTDTLTFVLPTALIGKDTTQTTLAFLLTVTDIHSAMSIQSVTVVVTKVDNGSIVLSGLSGQPTQADGSRELVAPSLSLTTDPDSTAENSGRITNYQWQQEIDGTWTDVEAANATTYIVPYTVKDNTKYRVLITYTDGQDNTATVPSVAIEYQLVNKPPLISITPASVDTDEGERVTFDASTTTDEHTELNFIWRQSSGTDVLAGVTTNTDTLTFVLPTALIGKDTTQTTLAFLLTVTDIHSAMSIQSVTVVVTKVDNGSIVLSGLSGQPTQADGSRELVAPSLSLTTDPDSTAENSGSITNYQWQHEIDGTWTDVEVANVATYTVPDTVKDNTKYRVLIAYTDGQNYATTVSSVAIEYQFVNKPPLISITPASVDADEGEQVTLDASATTDEHTELNFIWRQSSGTNVLAGVTTNTDTLTFAVPTALVGKDATQTTLAFLLTVTDIHSAMSIQSVTVVVTKVDNGSIVLSGLSGQPTQADGSRELVAPNLSLTTDPDSTAENSGSITNYQWQQEIDGTWTDVKAANVATYTVPPWVPDGTKYQVLIAYTDGQDYATTITSQVKYYTLVPTAPVVLLITHIMEGSTVILEAADVRDAEDDTVSYHWIEQGSQNVTSGKDKEQSQLEVTVPVDFVPATDTTRKLVFVVSVSDHHEVSAQRRTLLVTKKDNGQASLGVPVLQGNKLIAPKLSSDIDKGIGKIIGYQWQKKNGDWLDIPRATTTDYTVPDTTQDKTEFRVKVTYRDGQDYLTTVYSSALTYIVANYQPKIISPNNGSAIRVTEGREIMFGVTISDEDIGDELTLYLRAQKQLQDLVQIETTRVTVLPDFINKERTADMKLTGLKAGATVLTLVAEDDSKSTDSMTSDMVLLLIRVMANAVPIIEGLPQNNVRLLVGTTHGISVTLADEDEDDNANQLFASVSSSDDTVATATIDADGTTRQLVIEAGENVGNTTITVTVSDGNGVQQSSTVTKTFRVNVEANTTPTVTVSEKQIQQVPTMSVRIAQAPVVTFLEKQILQLGDDKEIVVTVGDSNNGSNDSIGVKALSSMREVVAITPQDVSGVGTHTFRLTGVSVGTAIITITVTDSKEQVTSETFEVLVNKPLVTGLAIPKQVATVGKAFRYQITSDAFLGAESGEMLTYTTAEELPSGMSLSATGILHGTPIDGTASTNTNGYLVTVIADDGNGGTAQAKFQLIIDAKAQGFSINPVDTNDDGFPDELHADTSKVSDANGLSSPGYSYQWWRATDKDSTPVAIGKNAIYELENSTTDRAEGRLYRVVVTFRDDAGQEEALEADYVVQNVAPVITPFATIQTTEGETVMLVAKARNPNGDSNLTYQYSVLSGDKNPSLLAGTSVEAATLSFKVPIDFVDADAEQTTVTLLLTVSDSDADETTQTILVVITKVDNDVITLREITRKGLVLTIPTPTVTDDSDGVKSEPNISYQWELCSVADGDDCSENSPDWSTPVNTADEATYTIASSEVKDGNQFRVAVTYTDGQDYTRAITKVFTFHAIRLRLKLFLEGALQ